VEKLLTVAETAALLSVRKNRVHELIHSGQLRSVKIRRCRRIPVSAIAVYLGECVERGAGAAGLAYGGSAVNDYE
jgi:excisionase family DNA binding protein